MIRPRLPRPLKRQFFGHQQRCPGSAFGLHLDISADDLRALPEEWAKPESGHCEVKSPTRLPEAPLT
jgi:hypothetical protein